MKISARNQIHGTVKTLIRGSVNGDVILDIGHGLEVFANITCEAMDELQLAVGADAIAIIKASFVLLSPDAEVRISARNRLTGTISAVLPGAVNSEIKLTLPSGQIICAIVTNESVTEMDFSIGKPCTALIKASHVLIATP